MKLLDRVWNLLGLVESDELEETEKNSPEKPLARSDRKPERSTKVVAEESRERKSLPPATVPSPNLTAKQISSLPAGREPAAAVGTVVITQPMGFDDARQIAENVKSGKTVLVNFERTDGETIKRTVDFMSGITYAVSGTVQRISNTIFLFAPARVEIYAPERFATDEPGALPWRRP